MIHLIEILFREMPEPTRDKAAALASPEEETQERMVDIRRDVQPKFEDMVARNKEGKGEGVLFWKAKLLHQS